MAYLGDNAIDIDPIETDNIGSLGSLVLPELPGCDDLLVRQQLGYALREFCRESNACTVENAACVEDGWCGRNRFIPMPSAPQGMIVQTVLDVRAEDGRSIDFEVQNHPFPRIVTNGLMSQGEKVRVRFSVVPMAGGESCPRWFKEKYAEAITAGAMHNLLLMSKKPWSDPARATLYAAKYADAVAEASYRSLGSAAQGGSESAIPCGGLFM